MAAHRLLTGQPGARLALSQAPTLVAFPAPVLTSVLQAMAMAIPLPITVVVGVLQTPSITETVQ